MNKFLISIGMITIIMISSGCATWDGIKEDSSTAYDATKEAIHDATK